MPVKVHELIEFLLKQDQDLEVIAYCGLDGGLETVDAPWLRTSVRYNNYGTGKFVTSDALVIE